MKTILIIDDSRTMRRIFEILLTPPAYQLVFSTNAHDAETLVHQGIDLVLVDVGLPGKQAYPLAQRVGSLAKIPVILLVSKFHPYEQDLGQELGNYTILKKPFDSQIVRSTIADTLSGVKVGSNALVVSPSAGLSPHTSPPPKEEQEADSWPEDTARHEGMGIPKMVPLMPRLPFLPRAPLPAPVVFALEQIARRGQAYEAIAQLSVEQIQKIAWEVVPELAKAILKTEPESHTEQEFIKERPRLT